MIAYKGFNNNLECTRGKGIYAYEVGKTYTEDKAKCANTGFHCVEEPIEVLHWYPEKDSRYCIVDAEGDINEIDNKISCTQMTIIREISRIELAVLECKWLQEHPERACSKQVQRDSGKCYKAGDFVIVRGKNPKAAGVKKSFFFLVKEAKNSCEIETIYAAYVDDEEVKANQYYGLWGEKLCRRKS